MWKRWWCVYWRFIYPVLLGAATLAVFDRSVSPDVRHGLLIATLVSAATLMPAIVRDAFAADPPKGDSDT